jgi:hypothetical protein
MALTSQRCAKSQDVVPPNAGWFQHGWAAPYRQLQRTRATMWMLYAQRVPVGQVAEKMTIADSSPLESRNWRVSLNPTEEFGEEKEGD